MRYILRAFKGLPRTGTKTHTKVQVHEVLRPAKTPQGVEQIVVEPLETTAISNALRNAREARRLGNSVQEIVHYEEVIKEDPEHSVAHLMLAATLDYWTKPKKAIDHAKVAANINPHSGLAKHLYHSTLWMKKRSEEKTLTIKELNAAIKDEIEVVEQAWLKLDFSTE